MPARSATQTPCEPAPAAAAVSPDALPGGFSVVALERLHTTYAALRPSTGLSGRPDLADLPPRVVPREDGDFEVLDGFQRLERWRAAGYVRAPVVIERPGRPAEHKRRLLAANAPRRTVTALDEAAVVASLRQEDGLGPQAIAHLLGHRAPWVDARLRIHARLSPRAKRLLAQRAIGPTLADALSACDPDDQEALLRGGLVHASPAQDRFRGTRRRSRSEPDRRAISSWTRAAISRAAL